MDDRLKVIESLRRRLPNGGEHFNLVEAIDAFEAGYRNDRFSGDGDSLTFVGWQVADDRSYYELALGRSIGGELFEFPTIVTARLQIPIETGVLLSSDVDERLGDMEPQPGQVLLWCDDADGAEAFFARLRGLAIVQKYGARASSLCELRLAGDEQLREITGKLLEYFAEHECPTNDEK